jgi:hypothetical protein
MERGSLVPPELRHSVQETPDLALELEVFAGTSRRHLGVAADLLCRDTTGSDRRVPPDATRNGACVGHLDNKVPAADELSVRVA